MCPICWAVRFPYLVLLLLEFFKSFFLKITPGCSHPYSTELRAVGGDVSDIWCISPHGSGKLKISAVDLKGKPQSKTALHGVVL